MVGDDMRNVRVFKKNMIILVLSSVSLITIFHKKQDIIPYYLITEEGCAFGNYSNGSVYIGDIQYVESLENLDSDNDVLVVDLREAEDPNMKIINSYVVDDQKQMKEVIAILCEYEKMYPSNWDRSKYTMYREWIVHNICHSFNYETNRTTDVDFNNADESLYKKLIFKVLD